MINFYKKFQNKKKGKLKRICSLFLSALMVLNTLSFDGATVFASEEQETESCSMESSEEGSGTKMLESEAEQTEKEETTDEETTEEKAVREGTAEEETTKEASTEAKQTDEETTQDETEEIIGEEETETENSEEEQVQEALGEIQPVSYRDCDADGKNWEEKTCAKYTEISSDTITWSDGWYVVNGAVTISSRVTVNGNVCLILTDSCTLEVKKGVTVNSGNGLTIYAQTDGDGMGSLKAGTEEYCAGIGGGDNKSGGKITINGGEVTAAGGLNGAGIGGGYDGSGGETTINGGKVTATGGVGAAGIGGGFYKSGGKITINGGKVTATGDFLGAGIGGSRDVPGGEITIKGGEITAAGGYNAAGIGGGSNGSSGTIMITGGTITAKKGEKASFDIGGGSSGSENTVFISGATVNGKMYYTVSFVVNMPDVNVPAQGIVQGEKAAEPSLEIEGYKISGWYTDADCEHQFDFGTSITSTLTLYAKLEESTDYIAEVTIGSEVKRYTAIASAYDALGGKTGTIRIKVLGNVTTTTTLTVSSGMDVTVEVAEGATYTNTSADCFQVHGGTLTLAGGKVIEEASGKSIVYAASGKLCITGGTYQSNAGNGLWIDKGTKVCLSGGTIGASGDTLRYESPCTLKEMLDTQTYECIAFHDNSDNPVTDILDKRTAKGTYTVKRYAEHHYGWRNEGTQHCQYCSGCGSEKDRGEHTFENDVCTVCQTEAAVKVEAEDGGVSNYTSIATAWDAVQGKTAKMTVLKNQSLTACMEIKDGNTDVTVEMADGVRLNSTSDFFIVQNGKLTLNSGTFISSGDGKSGIYMTDGTVVINGGMIQMTGSDQTKGIQIAGIGTLKICGGELSVTGSQGVALCVDNGTVLMNGGTLASTSNKALQVNISNKSVKSLLGEGLKIFKDGDSLTSELDGKELGIGIYTVAKCFHKYQYIHTKGTMVHERRCSLCGFVDGESIPCHYDWVSGSNKAVCTDCESCLTVTLDGTDGLVYDGAEKKPGVTVTLDDGSTLAKGYTITYSDNVNAGENTASVTIEGEIFEESYTWKFSISKAEGILTVPDTPIEKTYGDEEFSLNCETKGDGEISYVSGSKDVALVSADGTVRIKGAGTAEITVSLEEGKNYTGAAATVAVNVAKKDSYPADPINKRYLHIKEHTGEVNLAELLPADCGTVTYGTPDTSGKEIFKTLDVDGDGVLSYTLSKGNAGDNGTITVAVETQNYKDITITVNVELTSRIPVSEKKGEEVTLRNNTLVYGEPLSKLVFNKAVFVDGDNTEVKGALAWKNSSEMPNAGTVSAVWVFTPSDDQYEKLEGHISITVKKAVPKVTAPAAADRVFNPVLSLTDSDLSGGSAVGADGKTLRGVWSWKFANTVPAVGSSSYEAVFTPEDIVNYEAVTVIIPVTVTKAAPYIAALPTASSITYGDALDASILSDGAVWYGDGAGQAGNGSGSFEPVAGAFAWKEPSVKPAVSDSGVTEYTIVFTPEDAVNYNLVEAAVTLTVNKAQNAPNMPESSMDISDSIEKVGDIVLPEGWEWQETDKDNILEAGAAVSAVAVYTGADRGNYENETVTIIINVTKLSCDHVAGDDILYTGTGEMAPTCTEDGLGHRECTKCGIMIESGIAVPALGHDYIGEVTKEPTASADGERTYTCSRCGDAYTEPVPREIPEGLWISGLASSVTYTGSAVKPEGIRVYHGSTLLREKAEYTISYKNNMNAGTAQIIVTGKGSYKGKATAEFTIEALDLDTDTNISASIATATATGKNLKPSVTVTWNGKKLKEKTDYTLTYDADIKSPSAEGYDVIISGKGNYKGAIVRKFRVVPKGTPLLNSAKVTGIAKSYQYPAGEAQGNGNVKPIGLEEDLEKLVVKIGKTTLTKDTDYTVRIEKADAVGTGTIILEPTQESVYAGEKRIPFSIAGVDLKKGSITGLEKSYPYTGEAVRPEIRVYSGRKGTGTQIPSDAYTVRYSSCMNPGRATVTVTGIPEKGYSGSISAAYTIGKYDIGAGKTDGSITVTMPKDIRYAKGGAKPQPVITHTSNGTVRTLREGVDYTLKYSSNTSASGKNKPALKITGIGNYCGTVAEQYDIAAQDIGSLTITAADKAYNSKKKGSYYYSAPKVYDLDGKQLKQKTDYTVQYFDASTGQEIGKNDSVANGAQIRVTVTAAEGSSYTGTLSTTYYVRDAKDVRDIAKAKSDKIAPQQYTGSEIKPGVSLYTQIGKTKNYLTAEDYEIIGYYNNVKKGTATVLIRGRNAYSGVKSITFKITAADNGMIWSGIFSIFKS